MKHASTWVGALFVALLVAVAQAQDLAGQWQGTLQAGGRALRVVLKITNAPDTGLGAVFYSIDQGGQPVAAGGVSLQGSTLKFSIPAASASYEGRLSPDATSVAGTFMQGPTQIPLTLVRASGDAAWAIPAPPAAMRPMPLDAKPVFEVATIKPSEPNRPGRLYTMRGRQMMTVNTSVNNLIGFAYGLHPRQLVGGPDWLENDKYDVTGQPDVEGLPNQVQMRYLIERLLADRFKLAFHREPRELPVYAIVVGNNGHKLTKSAGTGALPSLLFRRPGLLPVQNASMVEFAAVMQSAVLDRPVVDRTGLEGRWDFTLTWTPDETQFASLGVRIPPPSPDAAGPPGLFTAVQEQLGLKFEPSRAPVDVVVIDKVERPTEN